MKILHNKRNTNINEIFNFSISAYVKKIYQMIHLATVCNFTLHTTLLAIDIFDRYISNNSNGFPIEPENLLPFSGLFFDHEKCYLGYVELACLIIAEQLNENTDKSFFLKKELNGHFEGIKNKIFEIGQSLNFVLHCPNFDEFLKFFFSI